MKRIRIKGSLRHVRCAWADCMRAADRRVTRTGHVRLFAFCSEEHGASWDKWKAKS